MSRRPKYREDDFPMPGTVFVATTLDGRLSAGRVLRREFHGGAQAALIAGTPWLGSELPRLDLPALRADRTWFMSWEDVESNMPLQECRFLVAKLVNELRAAPKLTLGVVSKHLKQCVKEFNRLDAQHQFISTIEREDLCDAFEQIACAAKFPQAVDQIDQWRDW